MTSQGAHEYVDDPRNRDVIVYVNGEMVPRERAVVSVFDAGFVLGDGVWEGVRGHAGRFAFLHQPLHRPDQALDRVWEAARALPPRGGLSRDELAPPLPRTLAANGMEDHVHVRLMVT